MVSNNLPRFFLPQSLTLQAEITDSHISVRFRHGVHTFYIYVDSQAPFSQVTEELISILRERYPRGLTTAVAPPKTTQVPDQPTLAYGALTVPNDPAQGWKRINVGADGASTPAKCGVKNNSLIAFAFVEDDQDDEVLFEVEWPREDDEMYEQGS